MCAAFQRDEIRARRGVSIATATHLLGDLDLEILETAARPGYGTSLPVRKHQGEPGHTGQTPTDPGRGHPQVSPQEVSPPSTLNIHTTPRPGREPQGPDQLSLLSTQSQTRTMPIMEWPNLEARWIVRGDTKASYDNSRRSPACSPSSVPTSSARHSVTDTRPHS